MFFFDKWKDCIFFNGWFLGGVRNILGFIGFGKLLCCIKVIFNFIWLGFFCLNEDIFLNLDFVEFLGG